MTASFVCLRILRSCSGDLCYRVPLGNFLFQVQVAGLQPPDTEKKYFTSSFQAFYTRRLDGAATRGVLYKKGVFRNLVKFTGKHLCRSLFFNKVAGLSPATLLKRDSGYWCFPVILRNF